MTKRILSMLLAVVTILSLAVPAFAEEPEAAEEPIITQEPVEEEAPAVEEPAAEEPEATEEPAEEEEPAEPEMTEAPAEEPEVTEEPVEPEEPAEADAPALISEPVPAASGVLASGACGLNGSASVTWKIEQNDDYLTSENSAWASLTLTISGAGPMENYEVFSETLKAPWDKEDASIRGINYCTGISRIVVEEGVTTIGDGAFAGCGLWHGIRSVSLPNTLTAIGKEAFSSSTLSQITLPDTVKTIGASAFEFTELTDLKLPSGLKEISDGMLMGTKLTSFTVPDSVTKIGWNAFGGCSELVSVVIPDTVTSMGSSAFSGCERLTDVRLPGGLKTLGSNMFYNCYALENITIPDSVTEIGSSVFSGCRRLTAVEFPASVTEVGYDMFKDCSSLTSVTFYNPKCELYYYDDWDGKYYSIVDMGLPSTAVVRGYDGSTAQTWAKQKGYTFQSMGPAPVTYKYAAPANIAVSPASTGIKVSWSKVSGAAKYRVYYRAAGTESWTKAGDTSKTSYTWTKAKPGTAYELTVRCLDKKSKAVSDYGAAVPFTWAKTPSITLSNTTEGVKASWSSDGAVKYKVTVNGAEQSIASGSTIPATASNTKFTVTVQAVDASGVPMSAVASKSITYIAAPAVKSVEGVSSGIKISWDKVSGASRYRVYYATKLDADGTPAWKKLTDVKSKYDSYTWKKATYGVKYYFTVGCVDSSGKKATSAKYETGANYITLLAAPSVSLANTPEGVKVSWKAVKEAVKYAVTVNGEVVKADETGTAYTFKAENDTTYKVTVQSLGADERTLGKVSSAKSIKHLAAPVIKGIEASSSGIQISWDKVDGASRYRVYYAAKLDADGTPAWKKLANTKSTSYNWKKAKPDTPYYFTVVCMDSKYKKATSAKYDDTNNAFTLLKTPTGTTALVKKGVDFSWSEIPGAEKYKVTVKKGKTVVKEPEVSGTVYHFTEAEGAANNTTYSFTVQALDAAGKTVSKLSSSKSRKYLAPPVITSAEAVSNGIKVSWEKVKGASKYQVCYVDDSGSPKKIATVSSKSSSYTWKKATVGTAYNIVVRCMDSKGKKATSALSDTKTVTYTK